MFPSIKIDVSELSDVSRWSMALAREQVPFATALALTRTGQDVKRELEAAMPRVFDRPTPYALRGWRLFPARKDKLQAEVAFRSAFGSGSDARDYLGPGIYGGKRVATGLERALRAAGHLPSSWYVVPGQGARLDAFGNVMRSQIIQVLSQLRITLTAGYTRNMSWSARKAINAQKRAGGRFFVLQPGQTKALPGVYQREFTGRNITPVFIFVKQPTYKVRLPMEDIARRVVSERLGPNFDDAWAQAMTTART